MTSKLKGTEGVEFPDSTVQGSAAYTKAESDAKPQEAFRATSNASQVLTTGVVAKLLFQTEEFDANASYDPALARFTPKISGYYQVNGQVQFGNATASLTQISIRKNGVSLQQARGVINAALSQTLAVSGVIEMNGTTDYLEIWAQQNTGANLAVITPDTWFSAAKVG